MANYNTREKAASEVNFSEFVRDILAPMLAHVNLNGTQYHSRPLTITARQVQDEYGLYAANIFKLMFKLLKRGGFSNKAQKGYKSVWIPNETALAIYIQWVESKPTEKTCKSLYTYLTQHEVQALQWDKDSKTWITIADKALSITEKRLKWQTVRASFLTLEDLEREAALYH